MAKQKTLTAMLQDRPKTILVQADIDAALHAEVKKKMEALKSSKLISWKVLIEAALQKWVSE